MAEGGLEIISDHTKAVEELQKLPTQGLITLDLEGKDLGNTKMGYIRLIQICEIKVGIILLDAKNIEPCIFKEKIFRQLMESQHIIKVVHGAVNDTKMLFEKHNITLMRIFDTQLLQKAISGQTKDEGTNCKDFVGILALCDEYKVDYPCKKKKLEMRQTLKENKKFCPWTEDVIPPEWIEYAAADASVLLHLYEKMKSHMEDARTLDLYTSLCEKKLYPRKLHQMETRSKKRQKVTPKTSKSSPANFRECQDGLLHLTIVGQSAKSYQEGACSMVNSTDLETPMDTSQSEETTGAGETRTSPKIKTERSPKGSPYQRKKSSKN